MAWPLRPLGSWEISKVFIHMGQAQGGKDRSVLRSLSMSVYKELTRVCKDWKPAASFSSLFYSLSSKPVERLADPIHCATPLCVPRFQTIVAMMSENPIWSRLHCMCVCPFLIQSLHPTKVPGSKLWVTWSSIIKHVCSLHEFRFDSHSTW